MSEENPFPDYVPKTTPDTVFDYVKDPESEIFEVLKKLNVSTGNTFPRIDLNQLKLALQLFKKYKREAKAHPGTYREGNMILGAPPKEYIPSEGELIVSELGRMINHVRKTHSEEELEEYCKKHGIHELEIDYDEIQFFHADVMGSGRFFYAEKTEMNEDHPIL